MLVLDYLKFIKNSRLPISPFHTGHLGLFPGTEISVSLLRSRQKHDSPCELLITPFSESPENLCRVRCTMKDQEGAVRRLLEAVAGLNLNVVTLESSVMNFKTQHHVVMVVDWKDSPHNNFRQTPRRVRHLYRRMAYRVPIHDWRYVLLYESIMHSCGDIVMMDEALRFPMPSISIIPFTPTESSGPTRDFIEERKQNEFQSDMPSSSRRQTQRMLNHFTIPKFQFHEILRETGLASDSPLPTVMYSSPNEKSLRVFIPTKEMVRQIVHLGFGHENLPGAVLAITRILEDSGFNILTGILRKQTASQSVYDVLLQYTGQEELPPDWLSPLVGARKYQEMIEWCHKRITQNAFDPAVTDQYKVTLHAPLYPRPHVEIEPIPLSQQDIVPTAETDRLSRTGQEQVTRDVKTSTLSTQSPESSVSSVSDRFSAASRNENSISKQLRGFIDGLDTPEQGLKQNQLQDRKRKFLADVEFRAKQEFPRIFLSYPHYARIHAEIVKRKLQAHKSETFEPHQHSFIVDEYQDADYEEIVRQVVQKIESCDYFIGIWHHEPHAASGRTSVSPWMPFEYGIAVAREKECMIMYSELLPAEITQRIDRGTATESYSDVTFMTSVGERQAMVDKIAEKAFGHWFPKWKRDWIKLEDVLEV